MANPPFNLFDVLLAVVLVGGFVHGRKNGLSAELLSTAKWLTLLLLCAATYHVAGNFIARTRLFDLLACYLFGYLGMALLGFLLYFILAPPWGPQLVGHRIF